MSGADVIVAGAIDPRDKAIVAQVPACGAQPPPPDPDGLLFASIRNILLPLVGFRFQNAQVSTDVDHADESLIGQMWRQLRSLSHSVFKNRNVILLATVYALTGMGTGTVTGCLSLLAFERFALSTTAIGVALSLYYLASVFATHDGLSV